MTECPCEEASVDNCEDCQDLPRGTLKYWRTLMEKECPFKEICPTTNYWVEEKKDFIKTTCDTEMHKICMQYDAFNTFHYTKGDKFWTELVQMYEERRKKYPPYGIMNADSKGWDMGRADPAAFIKHQKKASA